MSARQLDGWTRFDLPRLLRKESGNVGIELGVAAGSFSAAMVASGRFGRFFGVDIYGDSHDVNEMKAALRAVGLMQPYSLLRMTFDDALDLFEDESLDFAYVDGFAHTGEQGGQTIFDWADKVRVGGVIAGDDYSPDWPLVVQAVDAFVAATGFELMLTTEVQKDSLYSKYPSWAVIKTGPTQGLRPPEALVRKGEAAAARLRLYRAIGGPAKRAINRIRGR